MCGVDLIVLEWINFVSFSLVVVAAFCVFSVVLFCILTGTVESAKLRIVLRTPRYLPLVNVFMHRPLGVYEPTWVLPCLYSV